MIRSRLKVSGQLGARRLAIVLAFGALLQGCSLASGMPHLRPGSNVALPRPQENPLVDLVLGGCEAPKGTSRTPARDMVECVRQESVAPSTPAPRAAESPRTP